MIISGFHLQKGAKQIGVDYISASLLIKPVEHYMTHIGKRWLVSYYFNSIASAAKAIIRFKTPEDLYMHCVFNAYASLGSLLSIYENSTLTHVEDNALIPINRNRAASYESAIQEICFSPGGSESSSTLILPSQKIGTSGSPVARLPGEHRDENEYVLEPDTVYSIIVLSENADTDINIGLDWYETGITF